MLPHFGGQHIRTEVYLYYDSNKIRINKWNLDPNIYLDMEYFPLVRDLVDFKIVENKFNGNRQILKRIYNHCNSKNITVENSMYYENENQIILEFDYDNIETIMKPEDIKIYIRNQKFKKILG